MNKVYKHKEEVRKDVGKLKPLEVFIITLAIIAIAVCVVINGIHVDTSTQYVQVSTQYDYKITATIYGKDISNLLEVEGEVNTEQTGKYTIRYVFKYLSFLPTSEREVYVVDTIPPEITLNGDSEIHVYNINYYEEPGFSACDKYEGDLTNNVYTKLEMVTEDKYELKYFCEDSAGNKVVAVRTIYIDSPIGEVYLTFDDGPSSVTESILKTLEDKEVKATFFIIGYDESKEALLQKEYEAGNTIALHGFSHDYSEIYKSSDAVVQNFDNLRNMVKETLGIDAYFIRFPGGSSNAISKKYCKGVMTKTTQMVLDKGYVYFDWNVDSNDAGGAKTAEEIYQNVITGIKPGRANVVLMHDSSGHQPTAEALPNIIDWCLKNGYEIKPINETTPVIKHSVIN